MNILCNDNNKIITLYHISDIHIKAVINDDLREHYDDMINNVYNNIKTDANNSLIVITGDTLDTVYTVNAIDTIKFLFYKLASLAPVIYIVGNHEMQCKKDNNDMDMVTPLVSKYFKSEHKIFPLLKEGLYQYNNIIFGLTRMKSIEVYPTKSIRNSSEFKNHIFVGLHHGQVSHENMDAIVKKQCFLDVNEFEKQYDFTLLGDCHSFSFLDENNTIAYAGSLYEVNYREAGIKKGFIKWNICKNNKHKFIYIDGIIKHIVLKVIDGKLMNYNRENMPKKSKIKVIYSNTSMEDLDNIEKMIKSENTVIEYIVERDLDDIYLNPVITFGDTKKKIEDIKNNDAVIKMISKYIKSNNQDYNKNTIDKINIYLKSLINRIDYSFNDETMVFKLNSIKFSNIGLYGEDNIIDFSNYYNKICELSGKNGIGKSSIITVLLLGLYNECDNGIKYDCLNIKNISDGGKIVIEFNVNGINYKVSRTIKVRSHNKRECEEELLLYKNNKSITGKDNIETQKKIIELIGTYDDIINTNVILQKNAKSFTDLTNIEKKKLICKISKLEIFDEISKYVRSDLSSYNANIPKLKRNLMSLLSGENNNGNNIENAEKNILDNMLNAKENLIVLNVQKKMYDNMKSIFVKEKIEIEYELQKYDVNYDINYDVNYDDNTLDELKNNKYDVIKRINEYDNDINGILDKLSDSKFIDFENREKKFKKNIQMEIDKLIEQKNTVLTNILPDVDQIKIDKNKQSIKQKIEKLQKEIDNNNETINKYKNLLVKIDSKVNTMESTYEKYKELLNEKKNYDVNNKRIEMEIEKYKNKQENIGEIEYNKNCKSCIRLVNKITFEENILLLNEDLKNNNNTLKKVVKSLEKYGDYQKIYDEYVNNMKSNNKNNEKIRDIENNNKFHQKDIINLNKEMEKCEKEYEENNNIREQNKKYKNEILLIDNKINELKNKEIEYCNEYDELNDKKNKFEKEKSSLKEKLDKISKKIQVIENDKIKYNEIIKSINKIKILRNRLNNINNNIKDIQKSINDIEKQIISNNNIVVKNGIILEQAKGMKNELEKLENDKTIATIISKVVEKDGLQDTVLVNSVIPKIETDVNGLLKAISNFQIEIKYLKKTLQVYKIEDKKYRIVKFSGYESMALNIAFRLTFCNLGHNKYKFLFFDEIFSFADYDTLQNISKLFDYIRQHFDFAVVISHNDEIKKFCDILFNIEKVNGMSKLEIKK